MSPVELTDATGWTVSILTGVTILVAIFRRRWLEYHFWFGYLIAGLSFVHAAVSMGTPLDLGSATVLAGLIVALVGATVACFQVSLGNRLRRAEPGRRGRVRLLHIGIATSLVVLGATHVVLNGPLRSGLPGHLGI